MERYQEVIERAKKAHMKGDLETALNLYDKCLVFHQGDPFLLFCIGTALSQMGQFGMAIDHLTRVVEKRPDLPDGWHNLAICHRTMGQIERAVECYQKELALPNLSQFQVATIYSNWCGCYINEGNPHKVIELADQGLRYNADLPELRNHKALALLELGKYQEGFELYEARYNLPEFHKREFGKAPRWRGESVGKLAVHGEQGIGDEILFLTQIRKVLTRAEQVAVECTPRLLGLLRHSFRKEPRVAFYPDHETLSKNFTADAWCALGSLALHVWPPERHVYLESSRKYFRGERLRVGLSWRGGTLRTHEYHRNAPVEFWVPLIDRLKSLGVDVISLQYGEVRETAERFGIPHDAENIADLDTLAAMIASCDLVFSVCNTTIHMAGALGTPCIVMVPEKPAWRYGLTGEKSDWYDSVSYVRQGKGEGWQEAMARATAHLETWVKNAHQRAIPGTERAKA